MKLSECKYGILVQPTKHFLEVSGTHHRIGMITGISQNGAEEAIPLVKWQGNIWSFKFHHANLEVYND